MASQRSGSRGPVWSGDARHKDHRASIVEPSREELSTDSIWKVKRAAGTSRQPVRTIPQPRVASRLPQSQPYRRPSTSDVDKPRLNHQPQSWDSAASGSSGMSGTSIPTSPATTSSKLPAPSSKQRNVLRRKQSGLSQDITNTRNDSQNDSNRTSSSLSDPRVQTPLDAPAGPHFDRDLTQSPMEIRVAQQVEVAKTTPHTVTIYPELDRYRELMPFAQAGSSSFEMPYKIAPYDLPPPTPLFSCTSSQISGFSGSPSTRFSGSPGPGPYSRDTTPTSISSQSPGLVAPIRIPTTGSRMRQVEPALTRPPITRRRTDSISNEVDAVSADPHGLAAVRESLTSSSSNSTVRDGDRKDKKKKKRLSPLPPSPPPRKSSQKFKKSRDEDESPSKSSRQPAQPLMTSPLRAKATSYSLPRSAVLAQSIAIPRTTPPVRPSRDGTPDLQSQLGIPIPVIQSNLSSTSLSERRQSNYLASAPVGRPIFSSSLPEKQSYLSRRPVGREATPAPKSTALGEGMSTSKSDVGRTTRTPSPNVSTFKSRFPIFGRRTKPAPEAVQQDSKERSARKGPAAGTGHEGYGRLGSVRRKSSTIASTARATPGTMSSQESLDNTHSYDLFLAERMAPVVIAGGEVVENRNTSSELSRTESNQSFTLGRPSVESKSSSQISLSSRETPRHTLWPSPFPRNSSQAPSLSSRRPSDSSDSEALAMKSTLAFRRSVQRVQSGEQDPLRIPKPIVTRSQTISSSITSLDASIISDDSGFGPSAEATRTSRELDNTATLSGPKKLLKRARSPRKWNFFGRSQSQPPTEIKKDTSKTVAATVKVVQAKSVAFYTLMDSSELEDADTPDLEEVLREARSLAPTSDNVRAGSLEERRPSVTQDFLFEEPLALRAAGQQLPTAAKHTIVSPSNAMGSLAPRTRLSITPALLPVQQQQLTVRQASGRPSRLPQVGRIPKVVSARAEQTSPKSFSRPFHRLSAQAPLLRPDIQDPNFVAKGPSPPKPSTPELIQDESATTSATNISTIYSLPGEIPLEHGPPMHEFLSFSPRQNSQCTTTSSSSSGGLLTFAAATAVVPAPNAPLAEDEIWDEYNDLLGDETSRPPRSEGSTKKPPHLDVNKSESERIVEPSLESPTLSPPPLQSFGQTLYPENEHPASSIYSVDMVEQIKQALDIDPTPAPRSSGPGIYLGNDEQSHDVDSGERVEQVQRGSKIPEHQARRSDASGSSQSSDNSPLSQVNLRVGSMTVSKWLTFGHVLFSPVRDELVSEVGSLKRPSILVVDGLGNDDWSFYAAETYPAATFFNLSPRAPLQAERRGSSAFPLSPPNHHQIQYLSHGEKFPFGPQSFTAVVFRFPAAGPESQHRNIVSEARRVLKPGGFIELSILDVDLNNMGNRGRRSVRRLKERIHSTSPEISLGSNSDLMLRLLGRKGFTDIKTCRVGVPVVSPVPRSSGSDAGASSAKRISTGAGRGRGNSRPRKDNRSLPELISDESPVADESITKMVAKVGRWWYSRCYESAAVSASGPTFRTTMWNDKALLTECEEWGTSLKLMVCHARVPDGRARVASI